MSAADLLDRLEGVKPTGTCRWLARCPAHEDRHPSLSIRELEDGMTLVRCWAGCTFEQILDAVGLHASDLFPPKPLPSGVHHGQRRGKPFPAADILAAVANEAMIVAVTARDIANGQTLTNDDKVRLFVASGRLIAAAEAASRG